MEQPIPCSAYGSDGQPCREWAILGGRFCPSHVNQTPQTAGGMAQHFAEQRRSALAALCDLVPLAIATLKDLLGPDHNPNTRKGAANLLLSTTGYSITNAGSLSDAFADEPEVEDTAELDASITSYLVKLIRNTEASVHQQYEAAGLHLPDSDASGPEQSHE